jgi:hypothetical protein
VVTTNRKFQSPNGYSRQNGKRDVERLVAEELEPEPPSRLPRPHGSGPLPISRVTLEFGPRVMPRSGLDLRAVTAPAHWKQQLKQMLLRLGKQLLRFSRRQGKRLFHWIAWK